RLHGQGGMLGLGKGANYPDARHLSKHRPASGALVQPLRPSIPPGLCRRPGCRYAFSPSARQPTRTCMTGAAQQQNGDNPAPALEPTASAEARRAALYLVMAEIPEG